MNGSAPWWLWMVTVMCISAGVTRFGLVAWDAPPTHVCSSEVSTSVSSESRARPQVDLSNARIDRDEIRRGGPPIDGIPSLTTAAARGDGPRSSQIPDGEHPPVIVAADDGRADLADDARVLGVVVKGEARAYPVSVLIRHECVNDVLGDLPIAAIYCPLCDSFSVLDRRVGSGSDEAVLEFGISGLLHNSNVLLYDRADFGLWSQLRMEAVSGPRAGEPLRHLGDWSVTTWSDWKSRHPDTTVMTTDTGMARDYSGQPYAAFFASDEPMFPVAHEDDRLPPRTLVVGVLDVDGNASAYPFESLGDSRTVPTPEGDLLLQVDDDRLTVGDVPEGYRVAQAFWYAWVAAHPETALEPN